MGNKKKRPLFSAAVAKDLAAGVPNTPGLNHDNYDGDGNYAITMNMWWGNNGTLWRLYENDTLVHSETLVDNSPNAQTAAKQFTGKSAGTYTYKCELINAYGTAASNILTVVVAGGGGNTGSGIKIGDLDKERDALQLTIPQGTSEYSLRADSVAQPNFILATNNSSVIKYEIVNTTTLRLTGLRTGRASLKITETSSKKTRYVGVRVKNAQGIVPGMPDYLAIGSVSEDVQGDLDFWRDFGEGMTNKRMDIRYIYLNGGPNSGWRTWGNEDGGRAISFIRESLKLGMIPFFVYYNIPEGAESYDIDRQHMMDAGYMQAYYKDLKFLLDIINTEAGDEVVGLLLEPDFLGYMMQNSGKQPKDIMACTNAAYTAGILDTATDEVFPDTLEGFVKSVNYIIRKYAPKVYCGWQFNLWASPGITTGIPANGLIRITDGKGITAGRTALISEMQEICKYYMSAGVTSYGAGFVSVDKYGLDAGSTSPDDPEKSIWFWNIDHWNNYLLFAKTMRQATGLPVILWQIPVGHINSSTAQNPYNNGTFPDLTNQVQGYEDSAPTFFFGDTFTTTGTRLAYFSTNKGSDAKLSVNGNNVTWGAHTQETSDYGVAAILFGAGVGSSTDGVGSPPTDSYWWITKVQRYFSD